MYVPAVNAGRRECQLLESLVHQRSTVDPWRYSADCGDRRSFQLRRGVHVRSTLVILKNELGLGRR